MKWTVASVMLAPAALLGLGGCSAQTAHAPVTTPLAMATIAISVGPCFGFCPVYSVTVASDGTTTFEGERHTALLGRKQRDGGEVAYQRMFEALAPYRPANGAEAQTSCDQRISDQAHYTITWTSPDGIVTKLDHDKGCRSAANEALNAALQALPKQLGIEPWARQMTRPGASRG